MHALSPLVPRLFAILPSLRSVGCPHRPPPFSPTERLAVSPSPTCRRFLSRTPNPAPTVFPRLFDSCSCSLFRVRSLAGPSISSSVSFPILFLASLVKCSTKRGFYLHRYRTALDPCLYSLDLGDFANGPRFQHFDIAAKRIYHGGGFNTSKRNNFHLLRLPRRNFGFRETRTFLRDIHSRRGLVRSEYETTRWREHIKAAKTLPKGINFSFMRPVSSQRDTLCSFLLLLGFPIVSRLPLSKSSDYTLSYSR